MQAFRHIRLPALVAVSLLPLACGAPPEETPGTPVPPRGEQALTTLTATISSCVMQGPGRPNFTCEGAISGGAPPYFFNWMGVSNSTIFTMLPTGPSTSRANGRCTAFLQAQVNFSVTDSLGDTASADSFFTCTP